MAGTYVELLYTETVAALLLIYLTPTTTQHHNYSHPELGLLEHRRQRSKTSRACMKGKRSRSDAASWADRAGSLKLTEVEARR